jgi:hypothetical protein
MQFTSAPSVISECVRFERPSVWEMVGRSRAMRFGWRGRVLPTADDAHLMLRMEIELRGLVGLSAPLLRRRMRPELERDIAAIKARLEGAGPPPPDPAPGARRADAVIANAGLLAAVLAGRWDWDALGCRW